MNKKHGSKTTRTIMAISVVMFAGLSFLATPYVFGGVLMNPLWDDIRFVLLIVLAFEVALLDIRSFSRGQRALIWSYLAIFLLGRYVMSHRLTVNVLVLATPVSIYVLFKGNQKRSLPMHRLTVMTLLGVLFILSAVLDMQLLNRHAFLWSGAIAGIMLGTIGLVISVKFRVFENHNGYRWEIPLAFLIITPVVMFLMLHVTNYSLDDSEPVTYEVEISDLDVRSGYRQITQYNVSFDMDGETYTVGVPKDDYFSFHIGDPFEVHLYKGFFNEPYMIDG